MNRIFLILALSFSFAYSAITLKTVVFTDQEELASTYLIKYNSYQNFINLQLTATQAGYIMTCRNNNTPTLSCASTAGLTTATLMRIRENSYLLDWGLITNTMGLSVRDYNALLALMGLFIGFSILFFLVYLVINISRGK